MIVTKALIRMPNHDVHVQIDDLGIIQLFKYCEDTNQCDFEIFDSMHSVAASEWVHDLLPTIQYSINASVSNQIKSTNTIQQISNIKFIEIILNNNQMFISDLVLCNFFHDYRVYYISFLLFPFLSF